MAEATHGNFSFVREVDGVKYVGISELDQYRRRSDLFYFDHESEIVDAALEDCNKIRDTFGEPALPSMPRGVVGDMLHCPQANAIDHGIYVGGSMGITLVLTTRGCTLDTARRIGEALGTPWLNSNDPSFEDAWNRTSFFLELPETERVLGIVRMTPAMQTFVREFDEGEIDWLVDEIDKASKGMVSPGLIGSA